MVAIMSDEYAKCSGKDYDKIFNLMWKETEDFQARFYRKKHLKKKPMNLIRKFKIRKTLQYFKL